MEKPADTGSQEVAAFERLVRRHERSLRRLAYRIVGSAAVVDDVLQDSLLKAFRGFHEVRATGEAGQAAWLAKVVYHRSVDEVRGRQRQAALVAGARAQLRDTVAPADAIADVGAALAELEIDLRGPLVLVYVLGFDYATAADILGIRAGTLSSRLARGKHALRDLLRSASEVRSMR